MIERTEADKQKFADETQRVGASLHRGHRIVRDRSCTDPKVGGAVGF